MLWILTNKAHKCHCAAWGDTETEAQEARLDCRDRDGKGVCFVDGVYDAVDRDGRRYPVVKGKAVRAGFSMESGRKMEGGN